MNEETKEILNEIKHTIEISDYKNHYHLNEYFEVEHIAKSLDYITDLERDFHDIRLINMQLNDKLNNVQQENKKLEEERNLMACLVNDVQEDFEDYKSKCEKATVLLKRAYWIKEHEHNDDVVNMAINILQGDTNE